jgi:hypothetical protein
MRVGEISPPCSTPREPGFGRVLFCFLDLPAFLGALVYLIARGHGVRERAKAKIVA